MEVLSIYPKSIDVRAIERAVDIIRKGGVIIYPTDSNPALAADSLNPQAIATLCRLKGIDPAKQTLSIVCDSIAQAAQYARIDNRAFDIIRRNLPGPFTFILPPVAALPKQFKHRKQVGVRVPDNDIARALAEELGHPIVSGSLGNVDPFELESQVELMITDAMADADEPRQSTAIVSLLDSSNPEILREGPSELN
ncbi:MAG: threonylcarbamoyl-AMP synthase [Bacteroidales bacterium]|nr:threonylcarbamoyl-AMP synthase [Bacteroidales bacterium]MBD5294222.1 threonylcarbamoyl-AMP synthase [Bacteroides sp.]MBD5342355.1 threonylcarbamoyl-AMP synthase [Bacteroides sp.]MBD5352004.1 threonylcarbamoyl-AMP synthase [Bacteroides sp.]MBD5361671.1 threonylcarbamoyl-AMP synthase [Bacteroides sp.]